MSRTRIVTNLTTGERAAVPYTVEEEAAADAAYAAEQAALPDPPPPVVSLACMANLHVDEGDVQAVSVDSGVSFAFAASPNVIWVFFATSKTSGYTWSVSSTSGSPKVTDPQADYVEITITDPTEPYDLSIQIYVVS